MKIDHIAIVVEDLNDALTFYQDALGIEMDERRKVPDEGVEIAFLPLEASEIELLRPLDPGNSIGRFLEKRGAGIHHICLAVEDIEGTIDELEAKGARMATDIRTHPDGTRYAFIHPKSARGVLIELYEHPSTVTT